ncbi:forkhead box protein L1 [Chrysoperla carnea]|uniref:forkhead box protein L1 n=1 Tax=Chrysoperla carnea TaxID=189513 RepID=UPI001D06FA38|nr:forkhead box protein L1 [Chrysoperla carnea]
MCSNEPSGVVPPPTSSGGPNTSAVRMPLPIPPPMTGGGEIPAAPRPMLPIDHYRLQLYQYAVAERLRYPFPFPAPLPCYPLFPRALQPEEPKPQHSYIGLIAMAILSSPEGKLVLSDIYQHILDHYPYFRSRGPGWRNSIRHNLSLNDCFIKAGRSANGKGHYWAIHPANIDDFRKGDFRRRKAQRKVRRHMGLAVDEEGADSPSPPPLSVSPPAIAGPSTAVFPASMLAARGTSRKRQFDVASLLAPDSGEETAEEDIDVVSGDHHHPGHSAEPLVTSMRPTWPVLPLVSHYYQALLQQARPQSMQNLQTVSNELI